MLKSLARWRDFVYEKLENQSFGSNAEAFHKKDIILRNLKIITDKIASKKIFNQLTKLEDQNRTLKQKARQLLFPSQNFQEQQAVKIWFQSKEAESEEEICMKIYKKNNGWIKDKGQGIHKICQSCSFHFGARRS